MKKKIRKIVTMAFAVILLCTGFTANAKEQIKISDKEYAVVLEDASNVFIGNKTPVSGEVGTKVFLTYTVEKLNSNYATTSGVVATTRPHDAYPSSYGSQLWGSTQRDIGGLLFKEGYTFVFRFERTEKGFEYQALKMKDDKVANINFTLGTSVNDAFPFYGIWTGGTADDSVNAVLTHVRCYDENGNDLGVDTNALSKVKIYEDGEVENYEDIKAGFYCKENDTLLVLHDNKVAYVESELLGKEVDYRLMYGTQLTLKYPEGKEIWHYTHMRVTDSHDNIYFRLQDAKATFITGEEKIVKEINADTRYRVEKPEDPTKKGDEFLGWYLGSEQEFDFDSYTTESVTLYAKWRDGDGHEYLAVDSEGVNKWSIDFEPIIAIGASAVILAGLVVGYIILAKRRGKKNEQA